MSEQSLPESGVLRVRVTEDFELDGGAWKPAGEQKGWRIATIMPPSVPMFQQVVEYLETKPQSNRWRPRKKWQHFILML